MSHVSILQKNIPPLKDDGKRTRCVHNIVNTITFEVFDVVYLAKVQISK